MLDSKFHLKKNLFENNMPVGGTVTGAAIMKNSTEVP